jgi:3-phosphoshikimate 1-carboxyvinyltransferase
MEAFGRIAIVGVGLIGGSLALALRRAGLVTEVVGIGRSQANLDVALARGIVDRAGTDPALVAGCDLVLLATPAASLAAMAAAIAPQLAPGAIVTDAGSVKSSVVAACSSALAGRGRFVGAHPIAGTEDSGAAAADPDLFRGARCVLTPVDGTDAAALARVRELWTAVGMDVVAMSPAAHDELLALTSHVPHLLAFALTAAADAARTRNAGDPDPFAFAGPSFLGATRVAASAPEMWRDILVANAPAVSRALAGVRAALDALEQAAASADGERVATLVGQARAAKLRAVDAPSPAIPLAPRSVPVDDATVIRVPPAAAPLRGSIAVPGDKSIAHRALLFGGIASGTTVIRGVGQGQDNASTIHVLRALGVAVAREGGEVRVTGGGFAGLRAPSAVLDCGNSGTTLRLLTGVLAARPFVATLDGDASLRKRPMRRIAEPLARMGAVIESADGRPPLTVRGRALHAEEFQLAVASAQVKTALVLAGLQTRGRTVVEEPAASRDHTERLLPAFGARIERPRANVVVVEGPQELRACAVDVPGDPSAAAFWLVAGSIVPGSRIVVRGVSMNPTRIGAIDVLRAMGARITAHERAALGDEPVADLEVEAVRLHATVVAGDAMLRAIDEFPVLAVAAAVADGTTRFADGAELRVKESDRIAAMASGLARLGIAVEESSDGLVVHGGRLAGGEVESHGDHRIAMAFVVAALAARAPVTVRGADAIAVSDPGFLLTLAQLRRGAADGGGSGGS